jgi:hypothetical protein
MTTTTDSSAAFRDAMISRIAAAPQPHQVRFAFSKQKNVMHASKCVYYY